MAEQSSQSSRARSDLAVVIGGGVALSLVILAITFGLRFNSGGDGSSGGSGAASSGGSTIAVTLTEYKIAGTLTAKPGKITLDINNAGTMVHNVESTELGKKSADIAAGAHGTLDLGDVKAGTYEIFCNVAGHKAAGMTAKLVVSEDAAGSGSTDTAASGGAVDHNALVSGTASAAIYKQLDDDMNKTMLDFLEASSKTSKTGAQPMKPVMDGDTKVFNLTAEIVDWEVQKGKTVKAWAYNGVVPGPLIQVNIGDKVRIHLTNKLPMGTDMHLHGITLQDNAADGVAPLTQDLIESGKSFDYNFVATDEAVAMYHAHHHGQMQVINGLFAPLVIGDPKTWVPTGKTIGGRAIPAQINVKQQIEMVLNDAGNIGLTLNGKSFPATDPYSFAKGDWYIVNYYNEGVQAHPMHQHQLWQLVIAKDGVRLDSPYWVDTLNVAPGERYTVATWANAAGAWVWHCHILTHVESDAGVFGMATATIVK